VDYVAGQRGYRMLTAAFVRDQALFCRDEQLAYLAVHNHFGEDHVAFSGDDLRSHERGYPALRDLTRARSSAVSSSPKTRSPATSGLPQRVSD